MISVIALTQINYLKSLDLSYNKIEDLSPIVNMDKLEKLDLSFNPNLTKAQIAELQKALPNCKIEHNAK